MIKLRSVLRIFLLGSLFLVACRQTPASAEPSPVISPAPTEVSMSTETPVHPGVPRQAILENDLIRYVFDLQDGLSLEEISDPAVGANLIPSKSNQSALNLFTGSAILPGNANEDIASTHFIVSKVEVSSDGHEAEFWGQHPKLGLSFDLRIQLPEGQPLAIFDLQFINDGLDNLKLRIQYPFLDGIRLGGDPSSIRGALPIEIGTVRPLAKGTVFESVGFDTARALPHAVNSMELADLYDVSSGRGIFAEDWTGGTSRFHFKMTNQRIWSDQLIEIQPGSSYEFPALAVGIHQGDWHEAVDLYAQHFSSWKFTDVPAWLRDAGAIYGYGGEGAGGIYQNYPTIKLVDRIQSFAEMPKLLDEAKQLGTNVLYLWDYWEASPQGSHPAYWNKGDYLPRPDLGGSEAFKAGISAVHSRGGRVILYMEPFILYKYSMIGLEKGAKWAAIDPATSQIYAQYPDNYAVCPTLREWQDYLSGIARDLVSIYGADGIYLDSYGWQWNWPCTSQANPKIISASEWNQGMLDLIDSIRQSIRSVKPDAVVLTESFNDQMAQHADGSLDATFAWGFDLNAGRLLASPIRYAFPLVNVYSAGRDLAQLNQVFAAGHNLALSPNWLEHAPYIRQLVETRQTYKDALIHGHQVYQPATGDPLVAAYFYQGQTSQVITVVNASGNYFTGDILIHSSDSGTAWKDVLSGKIFIPYASGEFAALVVQLQKGDLLVLVAQKNP